MGWVVGVDDGASVLLSVWRACDGRRSRSERTGVLHIEARLRSRWTKSDERVVVYENVANRIGQCERNEANVTRRSARDESIGLPVGKWPRASTRSNPLDSATPMFAMSTDGCFPHFVSNGVPSGS